MEPTENEDQKRAAIRRGKRPAHDNESEGEQFDFSEANDFIDDVRNIFLLSYEEN